jgi:hypothetical protein
MPSRFLDTPREEMVVVKIFSRGGEGDGEAAVTQGGSA